MGLPSSDLLTVKETYGVLRIGRNKFYDLVRDGHLTTVKIGRRTLVRRSDLDAFVAALGKAGHQ